MGGSWHDAALAYCSAKIRKKARRFPDRKGQMIVPPLTTEDPVAPSTNGLSWFQNCSANIRPNARVSLRGLDKTPLRTVGLRTASRCPSRRPRRARRGVHIGRDKVITWNNLPAHSASTCGNVLFCALRPLMKTLTPHKGGTSSDWQGRYCRY
jgi:hypothetical protein